MSTTILIADDDPVQRRLLENAVGKMGFRTMMAEDGEQALNILQGPNSSAIGAMILDLVMPGLDGMGVLERMRELNIMRPVVVQTAQGGIETVVTAMRAGAQDFCVKPVAPERLKVSLQNALKLSAMENVVQKISKSNAGTFNFDDMIAESPSMANVIKMGKRAASSQIPVLIEGESGVGKEVVAQAIQGASERSGKPFITVNCGALPENLVESILFGHEKGAFTGANSNHVGKFKEADGGTLFLDEVGELSLDIQVKLLRALQEKEIDPVGASKPVKTDFRLISATNRNMIELVEAGQFREDLYYRLNVFPLTVPPLRSRKTDIAELVRHFTARICLEESRRNISGIHHSALAMLETYDWPGNVRQLENTIFRAIILCDGDELTINEFPQVATALSVEDSIAETDHAHVMPLSPTPSLQTPDIPAAATAMLGSDGEVRSLEDMECSMIRFAIDHHNGRMTRVAKSLGIGRSTLYRKLRAYGIEENLVATD